MEKIIDPSCPTGWIEKECIGSGAYSTIWEVCCGDNCNFVLKRNKPGIKTDLKKEAAILVKCANAGLCPKVYYSSETEFIMDRLDFPVSKLFEQYDDPIVNELIVKSLFDLLDRLHQIGLIHGDLHLENIMVKDGNPGLKEDLPISDLERYRQHDYSYYFVDLSGDETVQTPLDYLFLNDWGALIEYLPHRPNIESLISEKVHQLVDPSLVDPDTGVTNLMILGVNDILNYSFRRYLLENISPEVINWQDHEGNTILHHLAAQQNPYQRSIYRILIEAGADPMIRNHGGFLPIDYEEEEIL